MDSNKEADLETWNRLEQRYEHARKWAITAQDSMDFKMRSYLTHGGPNPTYSDKETLNEYWQVVLEIRNELDKLICKYCD